MSAIAPVKLTTILSNIMTTSDAAIGVDKTFDPEGFRQPGVARWVDRSGGIAIGYPSLTLSLRPPTKTSRVYKCVTKLDIPTLEVTSPSTASGIQPAPTLAYSCQANLEFLMPERSTQAERLALLNLVGSLFAATINSSDGTPSDATGTPLRTAIATFDQPY